MLALRMQVENQTALTVWVHPVSAESTGLSLFTRAGPAPTLEKMEVWQLRAATQPQGA